MKDERDWRLDELREEARYRRERLELYRARTYAGRAGNENRLREYQRSSDGASARLRHAEAQAQAQRLDNSRASRREGA
jgi:DNA topoisomerase IB